MNPSFKANSSNLNTILLLISIGGAVFTTVLFFAPLKTLPEDMQQMRANMEHVQKMQAVQTESLKILADVAKETKETRSEFDKHSARVDSSIESISHRLGMIEEKQDDR